MYTSVGSLHSRPIPICTSQVTRERGQSIRIQTDILAIAFLVPTRCNKDQLYLFEIANSHGHIGEQVRGDIEDWLKF